MQTRVSSSPPRARKDTTDFLDFLLRRADAPARLSRPRPATATGAALGTARAEDAALRAGAVLEALEVRVIELLGTCKLGIAPN